MEPPGPYLIRFWLRAVRIGVLVTGLVLVALGAYPFVPGHGAVHTAPYIGVLLAAALGGIVVALLPWRPLFERGMGPWFLYAWSVTDIVLISIVVVVTGGSHSPLFLLYFLTTVFFGVAYPARGQVGLLAFTFAAYFVAMAARGWHISAAELLVRTSSLGVLAILAGFVSAELMRQVAAQARTAEEAERWATLLSKVAGASRRMTLDPDRVIDVILESVAELGFDAAALCALDENGRTFRILQCTGMPEPPPGETYPIATGITGRVVAGGTTQVVEDRPGERRSPVVGRSTRFGAVCGTPVWVDGWLAAVLVGGSWERRPVLRQEVEALELLAAQAGLALENARRFAEEHESVERLEELDRMKSDFLATVSHELRTPVTVIEGVGLTLERTWQTLDETTRCELLASLNSNSRSLHGIITTLLDFSRLEAGRPEIRISAFDVGELLGGTVRRLEGMLEGRRMELAVDPGLVVRADPALTERVVENLLSNAMKHTPSDALIIASAYRVGPSVAVAVSDDGPGITEEDLPRLGERFFRGGDLNTRPKGLGLGLALVRNMLELQGSALEIESRMGQGSRFFFRLPSADGSASSPSEQAVRAT